MNDSTSDKPDNTQNNASGSPHDTTENQPAPIPSDTNETAAALLPMSERSEPYLYGSEVLQMLKNTGFARFSSQEIMLKMSADTIEQLALKGDDRLLVTILPNGTNGFTITITRNGEEITSLEAMEITLPYTLTDASATPYLSDGNGQEVAMGNLQKEQGLISFTLEHTGTFSILERSAVQQDSTYGDTTMGGSNQSDSDTSKDASVTTYMEQTSPSEHSHSNTLWLLAVFGLGVITLGFILFIHFYKKREK